MHQIDQLLGLSRVVNEHVLSHEAKLDQSPVHRIQVLQSDTRENAFPTPFYQSQNYNQLDI